MLDANGAKLELFDSVTRVECGGLFLVMSPPAPGSGKVRLMGLTGASHELPERLIKAEEEQ
jgi:hypothetical protein